MGIFNKTKKNKNYNESMVNKEKELNFSIRKTKLDENGMEYEVEEQHIVSNPAEDARKWTLKQLIKENAGEDYILEYNLVKYFDNVNKTVDEKIQFLNKIVLDQYLFNEFTKEIAELLKADEIFEKYAKLLDNKNI